MLPNKDFPAPDDPFVLFREWLDLASRTEPNDPTAMSLATASKEGYPAVRMVLLKSLNVGEIIFFSNRQSQKGQELEENPRAAICLHWKSLRRQIRAEGVVTLLPDADSDAYFHSRGRESQIGAAVSQQSRVLESRDVFERQLERFEKASAGQVIPRPHYWGGYRLKPERLEFWQEREHRLHDRIVYRHSSGVPDGAGAAGDAGAWLKERLYP